MVHRGTALHGSSRAPCLLSSVFTAKMSISSHIIGKTPIVGEIPKRMALAALVQERATVVREQYVEKATVSVPTRTIGHVEVFGVAVERVRPL